MLIVFISACVPSKPVHEEKVLPADRLIRKIEANRRKVKSFRGTGKLMVESPALDASASFEILLKKPDSIKVSIFGPFGIELVQSIVTKNNFKFYDALRNDLYVGSVNSDVLKKIFKVDLSFFDLMDAFTGSVNLTDKLRNEPDRYDILKDGYVLTYIDSTLMRESVYKVMSKDLSIINYRLVEIPNNILFEGRYSNFRDYNSIPIPLTTTIDYYEKNQKVIIEYRNIDVNLELDNLVIKTPNDVNIIEW
ncbi:DUF4292 domain-containing protein [Bacteroidota bacterium]